MIWVVEPGCELKSVWSQNFYVHHAQIKHVTMQSLDYLTTIFLPKNLKDMSGFYVKWILHVRELDLGKEIKSSEAEEAHTELQHCQYSCSFHRESFSLPFRVYSQILGMTLWTPSMRQNVHRAVTELSTKGLSRGSYWVVKQPAPV